jgi:hypothetical protein
VFQSFGPPPTLAEAHVGAESQRNRRARGSIV